LPVWEKRIDRKQTRKILWSRIKQSNADIFHFHDPELLFHGFFIKLFKRKKVIFDIHENVAWQILNKTYIPTRILRKIISSLYSYIQKISCSFFDVNIVAGDGILKNYSKREVINNYPILKAIKPATSKDFSYLAYLGGITRIRGIVESLQAIRMVNMKRDNKIKLILIGPFEDENLKYELLTEYKEEVEYLGILDQVSAFDKIKKCFAGFALYQPVPNHYNLRSNKVFEYLALKIPVIYPNYKDWIKKLGDGKVGYAVDPKRISEISSKIELLLNDKDGYRKILNNTRTLVDSNFSWDSEEKKLLHIYRKL
jgi:glycosyltransferase involved in cell wall biosynthesis